MATLFSRGFFRGCIGVFFVLFLLFPSPSLSENPAEELKIKPPVKEEAKKKRALGREKELARLYRQTPPDLPRIAGLYEAIFSLFPLDQQGKMAIWEAFHIHRGTGDTTAAMANLRTIYQAYKFDTTMENPMDPNHPINLHATADVEQAGIFAELMNTPLVAVDQLRSIPIRHPGAHVGIIHGERTYIGKVETIVLFKTAGALRDARQYNAAISKLRDVIAAHGEEKIGLQGGLREAAWVAMRFLEPILLEMPASRTKKLVELDEMTKLTRSELGRAEAHFVRAALFERRIETFSSQGDITQAEEEYRLVLKETPGLKFPTEKGTECMGPRAVTALAGLYSRLADNPQKIVLILEELEKDLKSENSSPEAQAYARLKRADIYLNRIKNTRQALLLLRDFGKDFPSVVVFPHSEKNPRMLFEVAREMEWEADKHLPQSPPDSTKAQGKTP